PAANAGADAATALLAVVSEKTGYPVEMLDLDMGLDSDLGIDSIKRVEILSAIQERLPDAPLIGPEHLGSLQTLGEIAGFLAGNSARAERVMPEPQAIAADIPSSVVEKHQDPHVIKRSGVIAVEMEAAAAEPLKLPADREILITDDGSRLPAQLFSQLQAKGCTVRLVRADDEKEIFSSAKLSGLVIIAPESGTDDSFLENAFLLLKRCASPLRQSGEAEAALFATVSRLDGSFGCTPGSTLADPLSGGLAGLA